MKKVLLLSFVLMLCGQAFSQVNFGLKLSPGLGLNRVDYNETAGQSFDAAGTGIRFSFGPEVYYGVSANSAFVTGLNYNVRRVGLQYTFTDIESGTGTSHREVYNLQYLQIPLYLHFLTNEIKTDTRVYINVGGSLDWRINSKVQSSSNPNPYVDKFRLYEGNLLVGSGLQYKLGEDTYVLAGLSYNRGLLNTISRVRTGYPNPNVQARTDLVALDLRLKF